MQKMIILHWLPQRYSAIGWSHLACFSQKTLSWKNKQWSCFAQKAEHFICVSQCMNAGTTDSWTFCENCGLPVPPLVPHVLFLRQIFPSLGILFLRVIRTVSCFVNSCFKLVYGKEQNHGWNVLNLSEVWWCCSAVFDRKTRLLWNKPYLFVSI